MCDACPVERSDEEVIGKQTPVEIPATPDTGSGKPPPIKGD